ncbi:GTPase ObgE [Candidatus Shapirobacteria bacterium CG03_land_8_20_14_0_80_40_19]|uniref:GTPase Obg n=2 Tax=Candidatus Shapironibacteriota TaxID=1752721 RepID=A0A2M7BG04_9BACT|nr:MAG: GTPase ObgE [Candidatus Shapirobacteria bacterium CG03_land_8_20_14_0_80_40_19]PJC75876.1 MAG: GTPase ObgE [Candidatus Shapirobacteria bacterium CG_4_8_14_3_um_filter_39_11]
MLVDEVEIKIRAGNGGDGKVNFLHAKYVPKGGPDGGDGGTGGDFYVLGVSDLSALSRFRYQKEFSAGDGKPGGPDRKTGVSGGDEEIKIPIGTVITDRESSEVWEITKAGEQIQIAKGGKGGKGNWHYKSATHQTPLEFEEGKPGKARTLYLELRLIADIGLIGLPSVGKSSLLNELTKANVKVAPYNFTTLEPNLGIMDGLIIADLPGLIEGAHEGKGLGIKFLKHIKRTKVLVHCISADSENPVKDYETIRRELGEYDKELLSRPEMVLITKSDLVSEKEIKLKIKNLEMIKRDILTVSIHDYDSLEKLKKRLLNC